MPTVPVRELLCLLLCCLHAGVAAPASGTPPNTNATTTASCPSYRCGHAVDIRYPFWIGGGGMDTSGAGNDSHCGYPSLRLECRGGTPVLRLPSGDYAVTRIVYGERTITLFDFAVSINHSCPLVAGRNLTLPGGSPPPLSLTPRDTNLTFYINCSFVGNPSQVPCLESTDGRHRTYVLRDTDNAMPYALIELCGGVVGMPVLRASLPKSRGPLDAVMPPLLQGFELRWMTAVGGECGECEMGGGLCGQRRDAFACFGHISRSSSPGPAMTLRLKLAVSSMVTIVALSCVCLVFNGVIRRRQAAARSAYQRFTTAS